MSTEGEKTYKQLNNELRREADKAREESWVEQCENLDVLDNKGRSDALCRKVRQFTRQSMMRNNRNEIQEKTNMLLTDKSDIKKERIY